MKVFRLRSKGSAPLTNSLDWFVSNEYTSNVIQSFPDPDGGKGNEPTSIPSPFARMDLVRLAFKYVNEGYKEDTTFYKIVSDTLDVAEIFYNYERLKDSIRVHEWDRANDLMKLKTSNLEEHKTLAEAIELYFGQDDTSFNFNHVSKFYFLSYQGKIIGGTSPITLFIPSGNDLSSIDIRFPNGDRSFDDSYCPLYERDSDFVKMLFDLRRSYPQFSTLFKDFSKYLDISLNKLREVNPALFTQIDNENLNTNINYNTSNYNQLSRGVNIVNGLPYYCSKNTMDDVKSDFEMKTHKVEGRIPLVLKPKHNGLKSDGRTPMRYFRANYNENVIEVPYHDEIEEIDKRTLPGLSGIVYPYITVSDFLEPNLIKTIYPINDRFFYDGLSQHNDNQDSIGFLLPLKKLYFKYFDIDDLDKLTHDGRKIFEMSLGSQGQVKVLLRIPVSNDNYIEYERVYYPQVSSRFQNDLANETENKGAIVELHFSISVYPTLELADPRDNHYRVGLFESDILPHTKGVRYSLIFNKLDGSVCKPVAVKNRNVKSDRNVNSFHYVINNDAFDYIEIDSGIGVKGIIIPKFKKLHNGVNEGIFAVDFGTTHTHIEYAITRNDVDPQPLSITSRDIQVAYLHKITDLSILDRNSKAVRALERLLPHFVYETIPELIGEETSPYGFPTRTAISSSTNLNIFEETFTLADLNIPFFFQKQPYSEASSINIELNLKWDEQSNENEKYLRHYFESLLLIIRNKALLNNCDLNKIKFVCSYPTSMLRWRRKLFEGFWTDLYEKYFSKSNKPKFITESIAPFYFLKEQGGLNSMSKPVLSIDVGGETTDFVIYVNDIPKIVSSARFATNAIYGDGFNYSVSTNGFVQFYKPIINKILVNGNYRDLESILKEAETRANSTDIINSYFALESNALHNPREEVSFSKMLMQGKEFKVVFVIFYAAIIYHISKLMKALNMPAPGYLTFSGMGSKVIRFIDHGGIEDLTNEIIGGVMGASKTEIYRDEEIEPKVITAKGGVYYGKDGGDTELNEENKYVLLGDNGQTIIGKNLSQTTYNELNQNTYEGVADEFFAFIELIEKVSMRMDFKNNFGFTHDDMKRYKNVIAKRTKVMEYIIRGVENKKKQLKEDTNQPIEETLFFYPLIGGLNRLAYEIYKNLNSK